MGLMAKLTIWYDGGCPLCSREIAWIRRLDWHQAIECHDISSPDTNCPVDRKELLARFHASENGVIVTGAEAFGAMWRAVPLLKPLGLAARNPLFLRFLERLYVRFLLIRPLLQRILAKQ
jgi:predicted DCC family thiol-disulfide oxidoreductase YuxK